MSSVTSTISDTFKSFSITGNNFFDTLIISSFIPIIIAYMNGMLSLIKSMVGQLFQIIMKYLKLQVKTRTIGNLLCKFKLEEDNELFSLIRNIVFDKSVASDISGESMINFLYDDEYDEKDKDNSNEYFKKWYKKRYEMDRSFNINKNYNGDGFLTPTHHFGFNDVDHKIFKYNSYLLKFTMRNFKTANDKVTNNTINIEILTFSAIEKTKDKKKYVKILEDFLKERFDMENSIYYVYKIKIVHRSFSDLIKKLVTNGFINSSSGLLKYGDNDFDNHFINNINENHYANSDMVVNIKIENLGDVNKNYKDDYELFDNTKNSFDTSLGFKSLYKKYISCDFKNFLGQLDHYSFFVKNKEIYFIYRMSDNYWHIEIISFGRRLKEIDITERLESLRVMAITNNSKVSDKKIKKNPILIYKRDGTKWKAYNLDKRDFSTIYLPDDTMNNIKFEIDKFLHNEQFYKKLEIPYKKGILFYGPPGTGKTSLVKALAYEYQLNIFMINVNDDEINDDTIVDLLNSLGGGKKILLFEDIDTAFSDKEKVKVETKYEEEKETYKLSKDTRSSTEKEETITYNSIPNNNQAKRKYLTYSGLLNALDGVLSNQRGVITIMTTNYINKLGAAFLRPGRIDAKFKLGDCNHEQISKMLNSLISRKIDLMKECLTDNSKYNKLIKKEFKKIQEHYTDDILENKIEEFATRLIDGDGMSKIKPCELQQYLLSNIDNIDDIFDNYLALYKFGS